MRPTNLESCGRRMDWYIEHGIPPHPADVEHCRQVAAGLRERGLRSGALFIEDRIREAFSNARMRDLANRLNPT